MYLEHIREHDPSHRAALASEALRVVVSLELRKLRAQRGGGSSRPCGSQKSCPGLPLGLLGFLARGAREQSCCAPVVYRCSPQLLLDREPGRGAHTGCRGGAPTTLGPEHSAPPNSLTAVMGPSGVGGSCGIRVGWGGGAAREPSGGS